MWPHVWPHSLWPHELQHARPPVHHQLPEFTQTHVHQVRDAIQPSHPFSSCPQSLTASGSFPMSQLFAWGGQSVRVSASASVLPMNYTVIYINDQVEKISLQIKSQYDKSKYKWLSKKSLMFKLPPMIPNYICVAKNDLYRSLHFHSFCLLRSKRKPHATHVHLKFIFSK